MHHGTLAPSFDPFLTSAWGEITFPSVVSKHFAFMSTSSYSTSMKAFTLLTKMTATKRAEVQLILHIYHMLILIFTHAFRNYY
jgi:hypothetical protein